MAILKRLLFLISFVLLLASNHVLSAQNALVSNDSIPLVSIPFGEIPSSLAQTRIKTATLLNAMISSEELIQRKLKNDTLAMQTRRMISDLLSRPQEEITARNIANSQLSIKKRKGEVKSEVDKMSSLINALDRTDTYIKKEKRVWAATRKKLVQENYSVNMLKHVSSVDTYLDSARLDVAGRTEMIFFILELCSSTNVALDEASFQLDKDLENLEEVFATTKSPTIFNLDYSEGNREFYVLVKSYLKNFTDDVVDYTDLKSGRMISAFVVFFVLLYFLFNNRKKFSSLQQALNNYYQRELGKMFKSPLNAALLLTLAIGSLVLKDRPLMVKNLMLYVSLVPLYVVSRHVIRKNLHSYILLFFLLILPIIGLSIFPPNNIFFRLALLTLAVCEGLIIGHFYLYQVKRISGPIMRWAGSVKGIVYVLFAFVFIGFVAAVIGKTMMAQTLLLTTFFSVYGAAIMYTSSVMINGLFITLIEGEQAKKINAFALYYAVLTKKFVRLVNILAFYSWLVLFLKHLRIWEPIANFFVHSFQYDWQIGEMNVNIGNIIIFFVVIYISTLLSRALQIILEGDVLNKMNMASGLPHSIAVMVRYTLVILGVVVAVSAIGLEFSNLAVVFGALGVGIGFGLQSVFNNLVSGLILLFERPVKIGDTIEIGELLGKVKTIGIRSSNIHTVDGAEVIVPNGHLVSNEVINWTLSDQRRRIEVMVGVSYDSDPQQVKRILQEILNSHPHILKDPEPTVLFVEMGESSLDFRMLFWTSSYSEWYRIRSEVVMSTFETLKKNGVEIPFPQRDVHIIREELL